VALLWGPPANHGERRNPRGVRGTFKVKKLSSALLNFRDLQNFAYTIRKKHLEKTGIDIKYNFSYTALKRSLERGAMKTVKTAISISEQIFLRAEETAKRLGMNRSQLFSTALAEFLERHQQDKITERLNEVYRGEESELDTVLAQMQFSSLCAKDWK